MTTNVIKLGRGKARRSQSSAVRGFTDEYGASARVNGRWRLNEYPPITEIEVNFLRALLQDFGAQRVAAWMGVHQVTMLRVAAGAGVRCRPDVMARIREFFAEADLHAVKRGEVTGRDSPQKRGTSTSGQRKK